MRNHQALIGIGTIIALSIVLMSCGKAPLNEGSSPSSSVESFQISGEDISKVSISQGPFSTGKDEKNNAVIDTPEDIKELAEILNNSPLLTGDETADYYRLLTIVKKDGSNITLEFGGNGRFFKNVDTGIFFKLELESKQEDLNKLIEGVEKK